MEEQIPDAPMNLSAVMGAKIHAAGEMADLIRALDWEKTSLGPIAQWPDTLVWSVNLMLESRFPTAIVWGPTMAHLYNDAFLPLTAEKHPSLLGLSARVVWAEAWHIVGPELDAVLQRGENVYRENVSVPCMRNGIIQDLYWTYSYSPIRNLSGDIEGMLIVCHDVTEPRAAIERLRESELLYERLFNSMYEGFCIIEPIETAPGEPLDFRYISANPTFVMQTGIGNVVGRTLREVIPTESDGWVQIYDDVIKTGESLRFERELTTTGRTLELFAFPCGEQKRPMVGVTFSDITVRKRAAAVEKALQKSERLAAVGRLTASIAHEINNPLEALTNLFYLALGDQGLGSETRSYLQGAEQELRRVAQITEQTLRFHRQSKTLVSVWVRDIVEPVLALYEGRLQQSRVALEKRIGGQDELSCYAGELRQVIVNLVANAFDAMRSGGRLQVRTRRATHPKTRVSGMRFTVADDGVGMDAETQTHIFEPFFTTKADTGTGLGLWVSKEIVEKHEGTFTFKSRQAPGHHGTVFSIFIKNLP